MLTLRSPLCAVVAHRRQQIAPSASSAKRILRNPRQQLRQRTALERRLFPPAGRRRCVVFCADDFGHVAFQVRHACDVSTKHRAVDGSHGHVISPSVPTPRQIDGFPGTVVCMTSCARCVLAPARAPEPILSSPNLALLMKNNGARRVPASANPTGFADFRRVRVAHIGDARHGVSPHAACQERSPRGCGERLGTTLEAEQHAPRHEKRRRFDHTHEQPGPDGRRDADEIARDESGLSFIERIQPEFPDPRETIARRRSGRAPEPARWP